MADFCGLDMSFWAARAERGKASLRQSGSAFGALFFDTRERVSFRGCDRSDLVRLGEMAGVVRSYSNPTHAMRPHEWGTGQEQKTLRAEVLHPTHDEDAVMDGAPGMA